MATRTTHVIQHLAFEHAGVIGNALRARGHALRVFQAGVDDLRPIADEPADLLLILAARSGSTKPMPIRGWKAKSR